LYFRAERLEDALRMAQRAVQAEPANAWYRVLLSDVYQRMDRLADAAKVYEELIKLNPTQVSYYFKWAALLQKSGKGLDAIKAFDELERKTGISAAAIQQKHAIFAALGDNKKAARELLRLTTAFPQNLNYKYELAAFFEKIGDKAQAKTAYQSILRIDPKDAKATVALAGDPAGQKNNSSTESKDLRATLEDPALSLDLKIAQLQPLLKNGQVPDQKLLDLIGILEKVYPSDAKVFAIAGDAWFASGNDKTALEKYLIALKLDDAVYPVWEQLLLCYENLGDCQALAQKCSAVIDVFPNKPLPYLMAAWADVMMGNPNAATDWLAQALLIAGKDAAMRQQILSVQGLALSMQNDATAADQAFIQALLLNSNSALILSRQAYSMSLRPNGVAQALTLAQKARDLDAKSAEVAQFYARVLYKNNSLTEAKTIFERLAPNGNPLMLEHYGDVLFRLGDTDAAMQQWERATKNGNGSSTLKKKIADKKLYE
jgi:tetratricopeptide (TPR) repeat protein